MSGFHQKGKNLAGFSMIELLVTFIILGIMASIAIPTFSTWRPRYQLKSAASELFANMQLAKLAAIKQNQDSSITFSTSPDQYTISGVTKDGVSPALIQLADYGSGVRFQGPGGQTFATSPLTFNSRGLSNQGYVYLSNSENSAYYRVGPLSSGVIKIQVYADATWKQKF